MQISVRGEVTNLRHQASGHLYFTLKDEGSQISAVIFKGVAQTLTRLPKQGDEIIVKGQISLYAPRGTYQILIRSVEYAGVGDLLMQFHKLKEKLDKEGLFAPAHKKALPAFPKTIGIITSPTGSVIQDILRVIERRHAGVRLILNPVRVQGKGSELEIAKAIGEMNAHNLADVLIVGRGGGSIEDLWPFNEECVARAVFASKTPIISAVGHETDISICDHVADVRAPTPSAAAEIAVREKGAQLERLQEIKIRLQTIIGSQIKHQRALLYRFASHPLFTTPSALLATRLQKVDEMTTLLDRGLATSIQTKKVHIDTFKKQLSTLKPSQKITSAKEKLQTFIKQIEESMVYKLQMRREKLHGLTSHLSAIDPKNVLKKGYCIPFSENSSSVILSSKTVESGTRLSLQFHDGKIKVEAS